MEEWQIMIPTEYTQKLSIPVSFDVKRQNKRNYFAVFTIMFVVFVVLTLITIGWFLSDRMILVKLLIIPVWWLVILFYRIFIFKEGKISDAYEIQKELDFKTDLSLIWGIYEIDNKPPYIVHYLNNFKGIFVRFKKDVIQGKEDDIEFEHYKAIAEAYKVAHELGLNLIPIDYMDNVGNDERMEELMTMNKSSNPELEGMLLGVYSNLKYLMQQQFSSYDVVLMYMRTSPDDLWFRVKQVIEEFKHANYKSYEIMNEPNLRILVKELYNLEDFSIYDAEKIILSTRVKQVLRPINLIKPDGTVKKLNMTFEEEILEEERKKQEKKQSKVTTEAKKQNKKIDLEEKRKEYANINNTEEIFDLFNTNEWGIDTKDKTNIVQENISGVDNIKDVKNINNRYQTVNKLAEKGLITQEEINKRESEYQNYKKEREAAWTKQLKLDDEEVKENLDKELDIF